MSQRRVVFAEHDIFVATVTGQSGLISSGNLFRWTEISANFKKLIGFASLGDYLKEI